MLNDLDKVRLFAAQIEQESNNDPRAKSHAGARGLMQIMPATAKDPGFGVAPWSSDDPYDAKESVRFGTDYQNAMFNFMQDKGFEGEDALRRSLIAYNYGPGNAVKWDGDPMSLPKEAREYHQRIYDNRYKNPEWQPRDPEIVAMVQEQLGVSKPVAEDIVAKKNSVEEIVLESSPPIPPPVPFRQPAQRKNLWQTVATRIRGLFKTHRES